MLNWQTLIWWPAFVATRTGCLVFPIIYLIYIVLSTPWSTRHPLKQFNTTALRTAKTNGEQEKWSHCNEQVCKILWLSIKQQSSSNSCNIVMLPFLNLQCLVVPCRILHFHTKPTRHILSCPLLFFTFILYSFTYSSNTIIQFHLFQPQFLNLHLKPRGTLPSTAKPDHFSPYSALLLHWHVT